MESRIPRMGWIALAAVLMALVLVTVRAAPAHAAKGMELAIEDEDAFVDQKIGSRLEAFKAASALGATRMRILVQWARVSDAASSTPTDAPDYNWAPIDDAIDVAALNGMHVQLTLTGPAPAYGAALYKGYRVKNPRPERYGDFVRAAAEHFKGRVDRYAIWNEPNYPSWIAPQAQSPKIYRALYEAGYDAVKSVDPAAQVLIGETVPYGGRFHGKQLGLATPPLKWLRAVACVNAHYRRVGKCTPLKADGYAHHPYEFTTSPSSRRFPGADNAPIQTLGRLRGALSKLARAGALTDAKRRPLDIYLTESGYFVSGKRKVAPKVRARWLPAQFERAVREPHVRSMLQYNVFVPVTSTFTTGLYSADGRALPEWTSLQAWAQKAASTGRIKPNTGPIEIPPRPVPPMPGAAPPTPLPPTCQVEVLGICLLA